MKKWNWSKILSYTVVALLSVILTVSVMLGVYVFNQRDVSKLTILEQLIINRFIGDVDKTAIEDAAANAMVNALGDRWSYYIPADEYAAYMEQMRNAYVGIGITITPETDGSIKVVTVTANGPAEEAGVQVDDVIVKVDGQSIIGLDLSESKKLIQGKENSKVQITVVRNGEEHTLEVVRRTIQTPVVKKELLENNIGLVTIYNFNTNCATETIAAIDDLVTQGAEKIIFDVRNNPGGYAHELVKVLDYLLPEGKLFITEDYAGNTQTEMSDESFLDLPMAVLVNGNSYSAAEFFAAALNEYDAAVVVGEKTTGKGYFQSTFQLPDGSAVGLSIGKYYTPQGNSLADVGITPQIPVALSEEAAAKLLAGQLAPWEDAQLQAAIEALSHS